MRNTQITDRLHSPITAAYNVSQRPNAACLGLDLGLIAKVECSANTKLDGFDVGEMQLE